MKVVTDDMADPLVLDDEDDCLVVVYVAGHDEPMFVIWEAGESAIAFDDALAREVRATYGDDADIVWSEDVTEYYCQEA